MNGGKKCVLLGKRVKKSGGSEIAGINTWVAVDNQEVTCHSVNFVDYRLR